MSSAGGSWASRTWNEAKYLVTLHNYSKHKLHSIIIRSHPMVATKLVFRQTRCAAIPRTTLAFVQAASHPDRVQARLLDRPLEMSPHCPLQTAQNPRSLCALALVEPRRLQGTTTRKQSA